MVRADLTQELVDKFGKQVDAVGLQDRGNRAEATVIYHQGIKCFDEVLYPYVFAETNCLLEIMSFENCVLFHLMLANAKSLSLFIIWRNQITTMEVKDDEKIAIPKFELLKALAPTSPIGGGLGALISMGRNDIFKNKKDFKVVGSKESTGSILTLNYIDEDTKDERNIIVLLPKSYVEFTKSAFDINWKPQLSESDKKSSNCYIATVCYNHAYAPEVQILRQFRDKFLAKKYLGRIFISIYYIISPNLVKYFKRNSLLRRFVRYVLLDNLVDYINRKYFDSIDNSPK